MQSFNENGDVVQTVPVDPDKPITLALAVKAAQEKGAVQHVISALPVENEIVRIKGLKYLVRSTDDAKGRMVVELMKPEDQKDSHDERRHEKKRRV